MTSHGDREPELPMCGVCRQPGADACTRMVATPDGGTRFEYSHLQCAADRGLGSLFLRTTRTEQAS